MLLLFASALFLSVAQFLGVQPMVAWMILPLIGGSPGVGGVCMLFSQAALLSAYADARARTAWLGKRQPALPLAGRSLFPLMRLRAASAATAAELKEFLHDPQRRSPPIHPGEAPGSNDISNLTKHLTLRHRGGSGTQ